MKAAKGIAQPQVAAEEGILADVLEPTTSLLDEDEWSFREPKWRIHDRTHLEFAVDYEIPKELKKETYVWEAYFFIPRSLKVNSDTFEKRHIYRDLQSYVRLALPAMPLAEVAELPGERILTALSDATLGIQELRLFACQLRRSASEALRMIRKDIERGEVDELEPSCTSFAVLLRDSLTALRQVIPIAVHEETRITARWIDEDCSRIVEATLGQLSILLRRSGHEKLAATVAAGAVEEAIYRRDNDVGSVGYGDSDKRDVEHLEFRRHLLKRFSASVLWLHREVSEAGKWTLQALYAIAASVAMAFTVGLAFYHGTPDANAFNNLWKWATIVILAYAGKDRIKATLQGVFTKWVRKWMPDRRWRLEDRLKRIAVGTVRERSEFLKKKDIPAEVHAARVSTHQHRLEEQARPEHILWHKKDCEVNAEAVRSVDERYGAITEIFRLNLREWLVHTDNAKQRTVFADPDDQHIYTAMAPRVYNIAVVYRLRSTTDNDAPWRRVRVIISRKGIKRIERVL
ncbi:MAG: hypothetical protein ACI9KE_003694 [Polyangiales bacterium]|jgi:hypothetical protein